MKRTLRELTLEQFIELACKNVDILLDQGEEPTEELSNVAKSIMYEYRSIVDPPSIRSEMQSGKRKGSERARLVLYRLCMSLLSMGEVEEVKNDLSEIGWSVPDDKDVLMTKLTNESRRLEFKLKREDPEEDSEPMSNEDVRANFDKQIASLMTFFKMSIDPKTVSAAVFANIARQAYEMVEEQKKHLQQMKK